MVTYYKLNRNFNMARRGEARPGGAWHDPPPHSRIIETGRAMADEIQELIRHRNERHELWGWKDPRTTLTIACFIPFLRNPIFVACSRNNMDVAKSLHKRDGTKKTEALNLAKEYERHLINFLNQQED